MKPCVPWLCAVLTTAFFTPRLCGAADAGANGNTPEAVRNAMADYDAGLALLKAKRHNEALAAFRKALEKAGAVKEPAGRTVASVAANNAGNLLMLQGKAADAETLYRRAVASDAKHALAINNLGVALLKQGKTREALQTFEKAVKTDPRQGLALNNLASLLIQAGNLKVAAKYLATSLKLNPKNQRQTLLLTARLYDKADSKPEAQDKLWQSLVNTTDGSPNARLRLASEYLQAGLLPQTERIFNGLLKEKPEWPEARLQQARLRALQGRDAEAVKALRELIPLLPKEPAAKTDLAGLLIKTGNLSEAESLAREATRNFPADPAGWFVLGRSQEKLGRHLEAEKCYFEATRLDRGFANAWNNLGILAARREDVKTALTCYMNALFADPGNTEAQYNLGRSLVISKTDFERGVRLLVTASSGSGEAAARAKKFLADLETLSKGGDPGWKTADAKTKERR